MIYDRNYLRQTPLSEVCDLALHQLHPTEFEIVMAEEMYGLESAHEDELIAAEKRADEAEAEAAKLEQKIVELESDLDAEKDTVARLEEEIAELEAQLELLKPAA
jgi:peptidoglycan hydrolase CwlO-like protein